MCGYFCIGFIDFTFKGKTLTEYKNPFPPNNFEKKDDIRDFKLFYGQCICTKWNDIV